MARRHAPKLRPALELCETRALMSVGVPGPAGSAEDEPSVADISTLAFPPPVQVRGVTTGAYNLTPGRGNNVEVRLRGRGEFFGIGPAQVEGSFRPDRETADVTLLTPRGAIQMELTRVSGRLAAGRTSTYEVEVTRAGAPYAAFRGTGGVAELRLGPPTRPGSLPFGLGLNPPTLA